MMPSHRPKRERQCPLWLLLTVGATAIVLQAPKNLWLATAGLLLVVTLFAFTERSVLYSIGNRRFWLIGLFLAAMSGLLLGKKYETFAGIPISLDGLQVGLLIVIRAATFVSFIMALSRKISPDFLVRVFSRVGFAGAGGAMALGIQLLPQMIKGWQEKSNGERRGMLDRLARMVAHAADLADEVAQNLDVWMAKRKSAMLFVVTGEPGSGKSRFLQDLVTHLQSRGLSVGGFIQPSAMQADRRIGYDLKLLPDGSCFELARKKVEHGPKAWSLNESAVQQAGEHLLSQKQADVFIVDEIGRVERQGAGHWPVLARTLPMRGGVWVLSVRLGLVEHMTSRLGYTNPVELRFPATDSQKHDFLQQIEQAVKEFAELVEEEQ